MATLEITPATSDDFQTSILQHSATKSVLETSENLYTTENSLRDEENLQWAALEKLPTYNRLRVSLLNLNQVNVHDITLSDRKQLLDRLVQSVEDDNEYFVRKIRDRIEKVGGVQLPEVQVRYQDLNVSGNVHVGGRALPTLINSTLNVIESFLPFKGNKKSINILKDVSGVIKPGRMTLVLGPPGAGKTTLLKALDGKLEKDLKVTGSVTYNGHTMKEFIPQRTSAYVSQHDLHMGEMTVRETFDFSARCQGIEQRYVLREVARREKAQGIKPDLDIDAFMKAASVEVQKTSIVTDYILKFLALEKCCDSRIGDQTNRGISGGEKKRVTTGEMIVGPLSVFFMDEISTGLDSSTTYQIIKCLKHVVRELQKTMVISLLQPAPETFNLFDDIILLCEGQTVYHGPRDSITEFFEQMGFKCPDRKGIADFLQEVTSKKDQEQYWYDRRQPYRYISVEEFSQAFWSFYIGKDLGFELNEGYDKTKSHPSSLGKKKYGLSKWELLKACLDREILLMKRQAFVYIFKSVQIAFVAAITSTVFLKGTMDHTTLRGGQKYLGMIFFGLVNNMFNGLAEARLTMMRLPIFYKHRDAMFFPTWAYTFPTFISRLPLSLLESTVWVMITYFSVGLAPGLIRFVKQLCLMFSLHQMALSLFRCLAAVGRDQVVLSTLGSFILLVVFTLGGFIVSRENIHKWWIWGYWTSPLMYAQNAIAVNEFLASRWDQVGIILLKARGMFTEEYWYWIGIGVLWAYNLLFNVLYTLALAYLNPLGNSQATVDDCEETRSEMKSLTLTQEKKGMVLPFKPLSMVFENVSYSVSMPKEMKKVGEKKDRLQLLHSVSGSFRPGVLTCLMGVSGAGKTTLMDVLAGRKTGGYIDGSISISGYPKKQDTFARISGYCEQNDIHSPNVTVYESLLFSAWLRLPADVDDKTRKMFVEEVMGLVELQNLRDAMVGVPGESGLSTEQRKRLTIAVELVANPSIIFMDEPTSGLDARAAAIVMRTVRNVVDTGRTVVCTIHQPSIDIFESFDELLLLKRGGKVIYSGPLGRHSQALIKYFQEIRGVPRIDPEHNPAAWMLEVTSESSENRLGVDFEQIHLESVLYQENKRQMNQWNQTVGEDLHFNTKCSQPFWVQLKACVRKQMWSYWRNPRYNAVRFFFTMACAILLGSIFWKLGGKLETQQHLLNAMGAMFASVSFLGSSNASSVQPVVDRERNVSYRERAAGLYAALPYAISQVLMEIPYTLVQSIVYGLIVYFTLGFQLSVVKFLWFFFIMFFTFLYYTYYGMMTVALTPNATIATIVSSAFYGIWMLFAGFIVPKTGLPIWWRWFYYASPIAWTLNGLVTSQFGDMNTTMLTYNGDAMPIKEFIRSTYGFNRDMLPLVISVIVGFSVLFVFIFAVAIRFLKYQKR